MKFLISFSFFLLLLLFFACSSTKNLGENEYMLTKNSVEIVDYKGEEFDKLDNYVRPIPNKKFMGIFPIKTAIYGRFQPKELRDGTTKDTKFNQWMRKKGEAPVLYDTNNVVYSINQLKMAMFKKGYYNATVTPIVERNRKKKKAQVLYSLNIGKPYYIREIEYVIDIPQYRRIVLSDTANALVKVGNRYDEELLSEERERIIANIRNQGYFYVSSSIITIEVDSNNSHKVLTVDGNPTVSVSILLNFNEISDPEIKKKFEYKYHFNKVFVYTNYDVSFERNIAIDSTQFFSVRDKNDPTIYTFLSPYTERRFNKNRKIIKDFKYRVIATAIQTKKGEPYSQLSYDLSYKKLRALKNFSIINISFDEDLSQIDTVNKTGVLNTVYKLTRNKQHGISAVAEVRSDRSNLSFTYTNKNIFKGAEYMNINAYGGIYYYNWLNSRLKGGTYDYLTYGEVGGSLSFDFPRLIFFKRMQKENALNYNTSLKFGTSYSQLFSRLMLFANMTYRWSPSSSFSHSISPIDINTIDTRGSRNSYIIAEYPESYQRKFAKFFLLNCNYTLNYTHPVKNKKNDFRISLSAESSGALLTGLNMIVNKEEKWDLFNNYQYTTYEKVDITLRYSHSFNPKNLFLTRFNLGVAVPFTRGGVIPFEKSFFVGGSNSMRGWTFRSLGPGGYYAENYFECSGDIKIELNLEYQGTLYKALKYAIFTDVGNIWLSSQYEGMPNAEFRFNRFYKELGFCVGAGLRIDLGFFIVRLDYGVPIYDPSIPEGNRWIQKSWLDNKWWKWSQGLQFGIGHAF